MNISELLLVLKGKNPILLFQGLKRIVNESINNKEIVDQLFELRTVLLQENIEIKYKDKLKIG